MVRAVSDTILVEIAMKYGVALPNFGKYAGKESILRIAKTSEELGFDSVWVSDHIIIPDSHDGFGDVFYEPLTTLTFVAAHTSKVSLGTSVIILPYRNPIVLAKNISTLDVLSHGRVIFGVGVGWLKDEFDALGVSYEKRGAITDEYIEVMKALWTEDSPEFMGNYHQFSNLKFLPKTVQKPHPPIWIGGNSKRAIERAASLGNGWHPVGLTPEEVREKAEYAHELLDRKGRKKFDFTISLRKNLQITSRKDIDERETLRGTEEKISEGIEQFKEVGVSHLVFQVLARSLEETVRTMEIFSEKINSKLN